MPLVFGYGSLVPEGGDATGARRAVLTGYRRTWGVAMDNSEDIPGYKHFEDPLTGERPPVWVAFVDLQPADPAAEVTGTVLEVEEALLPALDARERNYTRERVSTSEGEAWAYIGSPDGRARLARGVAAGRAVVADEYLERVRAGHAALGPDGLARFERETGPRPGPVRRLRVVPHPPAGTSITAMATAVARGRHRAEDAPPHVFDDPFALDLVGPAWPEIARRTVARYGEQGDRRLRAGMILRARYAEDRLAASGARQFVILGAGLDTYAWRHPELGGLRVIEVDRPESQEWKRERAHALGLAENPGVTYLALNFESETLGHGLRRAGLDPAATAFFSWLGVTMYLTGEAIEATLGTVAACAPGSEIVLTYAYADAELDEAARRARATLATLVASVGEPFRSRFTRAEMEALLERCGLEVAEHPEVEALTGRYFGGRDDDLRPRATEGLIAARVPAPS